MPLPFIIGGVGLAVGALSERYGLPWIPNYRDLPNIVTQETNFDVEGYALIRAREILIAEEGRHNNVYIDSEGYLTVGIGHKIYDGDNLEYGDRINDAQIDAYFNADVATAFNAAVSQSKELDKYNVEMIARLTSVNFQLGTNWRAKFPNTWSLLKNGNLEQAVRNLSQSAWAKQTPTRVSNFIITLKNQFA